MNPTYIRAIYARLERRERWRRRRQLALAWAVFIAAFAWPVLAFRLWGAS